jgi:integrase
MKPKTKDISYAETKQVISQLKHATTDPLKNLQLTAAVALQYACATRVSEIATVKKSEIENKGDYLEVKVKNRKNKNMTDKRIPILKKEEWLYEPISDWLDICGENVVPWQSETLRKYIRKHTGYSSHVFRHSRATHLSTLFDCDLPELKRLLGHARESTTMIYIHKKTSDIVARMSYALKKRDEVENEYE